MNELLDNLDYILVYIDDVLILQYEDKTEADLLQKFEMVLQRLKERRFCAHLKKRFFMQREVEYLGYQLISDGLKPQQKKLIAIKRILPPTNLK